MPNFQQRLNQNSRGGKREVNFHHACCCNLVVHVGLLSQRKNSARGVSLSAWSNRNNKLSDQQNKFVAVV